MERDKQRSKYTAESERSQEMNGNSSYLGKRKKTRKKKHGDYLHEWLDKSCAFQQQNGGLYGLDGENNDTMLHWPSPTTLPMTGQRLFTAVSDPTVCQYSVPLGYSLEPISLPLYPVYQPPMANPAWRQGFKPSARGLVRPRARRSHREYPPPVSYDNYLRVPTAQPPPCPQPGPNGEDYASLPPVTQPQMSNSARRRFSDPGLGPPLSQESGDSSDSRSSRGSSPTTAGLVMNLVEQVGALQDNNRRLFRELQDTRSELEALKTKSASWRQFPPDYEPGTLSDLVREVRDAAKVREEALLSRLCNMMQGTEGGKLLSQQLKSGLTFVDSSAQDALKLDSAKSQTTGEKSPRLDQAEEQLKNLRLHHTVQESSIQNERKSDSGDGDVESPLLSQQLCDMEKEKLGLRRELQEALAARKLAETNSQRLERLVGVLRKKINGDVALDEKNGPTSLEPSSLENTSESLVSSVSGSSTHSPHVTMSGPVTDL